MGKGEINKMFKLIALIVIAAFWLWFESHRQTIKKRYETVYKSEPLTPYQFFLGSKEWGVIRDNLFSLKGKQCERCKSTHNICVHHLNYSKPWGQEEPEDLEILCRSCHEKEHGL